MRQATALDTLADACGIVGEFKDLSGKTCPTSVETKKALLHANGLDVDSPALVAETLQDLHNTQRQRIVPPEIVRFGSDRVQVKSEEQAHWHLVLEGDEAVVAEGRTDSDTGFINLPDLPVGLHRLTVTHQGQVQTCRVIAAPQKAPLISSIIGRERIWGITGALCGMQSSDAPGPGHFGDLAVAAESCATAGAAFLGINPVHTLGWTNDGVISPYSPSHRGFLNSAHIDVDSVPGVYARNHPSWSDWQQVRGGAASDQIDYADHARLHKPLLVNLHGDFLTAAIPSRMAAYLKFCADGGAALARFVQFEVLSAKFGSDWRTWPDEAQNPPPIPLETLPLSAPEHFHAWLQWTALQQLDDASQRGKQAGFPLGLYLDLAVGSRRDGAEAWCESGAVARDVSVGAPPDHLSPAGQNWSIIGYAPRNLAATDYSAWRTVLRQTMKTAGMIRIDHALGLKRSYWIPDDGSPGGYINQPFNALLALICIEAHRANTIVVGEDLGLVPKGFRQEMQQRGLYSYSVLQYEQDKAGNIRNPDTLPQQSLICFGTHDTPTLAGYCKGRDIDWWEKLSWISPIEAKTNHKKREKQVDSLARLSPSSPVVDDDTNRQLPSFEMIRTAVHHSLAHSKAAMVSIQLDDLLGVVEAQNLPGTIDQHPNWRRRYELQVAQLTGLASLRKTAELMHGAGRDQDSVHNEESRR